MSGDDIELEPEVGEQPRTTIKLLSFEDEPSSPRWLGRGRASWMREQKAEAVNWTLPCFDEEDDGIHYYT